jgi:NADH:ubiquinone oxidoreductase subunit 2 (subunit N)
MCLILTVVLFALYAFSPLTRFQLELSGIQGPFAALIFYLGGLLHVEGMSKSTWDLQLIFNSTLTIGLGFTLVLFVFLSLITLKEKQQLLHLKFSLLLGAGTILASQGFSLTLASIEIQSYATYLILGSQNHLTKSYGHITYFLIGSIGTLCLIFGWSLGASVGMTEGVTSPT